MSMTIPIGRGLLAMVDDADFEAVIRFSWCPSRKSAGEGYYAIASIRDPLSGRRRTLYMHRLLLAAPKGVQVDHANGNGLDNRRSNLRLCNQTQNNANARFGRSRTGYRGVYRSSHASTYFAEIQVSGKKRKLGTFTDPGLAAAAYDDAALAAFGEFATLNFPPKESA